jgi:hypothetical protein
MRSIAVKFNEQGTIVVIHTIGNLAEQKYNRKIHCIGPPLYRVNLQLRELLGYLASQYRREMSKNARPANHKSDLIVTETRIIDTVSKPELIVPDELP